MTVGTFKLRSTLWHTEPKSARPNALREWVPYDEHLLPTLRSISTLLAGVALDGLPVATRPGCWTDSEAIRASRAR